MYDASGDPTISRAMHNRVLHVGLAGLAYVVLALDQPVLPALLAALYVVATTLPLVQVLAPPGERTQYSLVLIHVAIGVSLPGLAVLVAAAQGAPPWTGLALYGAGLYGAWLSRARQERGDHADGSSPSAAAASPRPRARADAVLALGLCVLGVLPAFVYAALMGRGPFPAVFFNADNPYHLSHVWSMVQSATYPVPSLGVYAEPRVYQFGGQAAAAVLSRVSGLAPHAAYLGVLYPLYKLGTVAVAWQFGRRLGGRAPLWVTAGLLAVFSRFPPDVREVRAVFDLLAGRIDFGAPRLPDLFDIEHVLTHFGVFAALLVAVALVTGRSTGLRAPALVALAMLPAFKMSFFLGVGAGLGAYLLWQALEARSWRPLLPGIGTLVAALALVRALGLASGDTAGGLVLSPLAHLSDLSAPVIRRAAGALGEATLRGTVRGLWQLATDYLATFHWLAMAALALVLVGWRRRTLGALPPGDGHVWRWGRWFVVPAAPLVLVNIVKYTRGAVDNESIRSSIDPTYALVPYLTLVAVLAVLADAAPHLTTRRRRVLFGAWGLYAAFFALAQANAAVAVALDPRVGYEMADNRDIAPLLREVPVSGALIATNDTRYPANGFNRAELQMQIPAVFGHHAYFVDATNDRFAVTAARRDRQRRLQQPAWDADLAGLAAREGWTHVLVRRDWPHPASIPLPLVAQNDAYVLFRVP